MPSDSLPPTRAYRRRVDMWGPARVLLWSWWAWTAIALALTAWKDFVSTIPLFIIAAITYFFQPASPRQASRLAPPFSVASPEFLDSLAGATDKTVTQGNRIEILSNGDEFFPRMLEDVSRAKRSITLEAYIYWAGEIGWRFARAFAAKAEQGVKVRLLLDAVGSSAISDEIFDYLESAGCEIKWFHPVTWFKLRRLQNRTHRKSLVLDGRVGYTGGAGIADIWTGNAQDVDHWRDTQIRIEGPAVTTLQSGFVNNWLETTDEILVGEDYFPPALGAPAGSLPALSVLSSPEDGASAIRIMYDLSIACARERLYIANPYFVPDNAAIDYLVQARSRGVDVKILVAGRHNDSKLARFISVGLYGDLLEAGVEVYEYNRTMLHHKLMVVDGVWATVGTSNFDSRSFALNDESNVCVRDPGFALELEGHFLRDLALSDRVELHQWRRRGIPHRLVEVCAAVLREQV